jgi:L-cystine uptake protein TcyP (sodium:dicarboxylate symporter family)
MSEFPKAERSGANKMVIFALVIFTVVVGSAFMIGEPENGKSRFEHFKDKVEEKMGIVKKQNSDYIAYDPEQKPLPAKK